MSGSQITVLVLAVGGNVSQGILKALAKSRLSLRVVGADVSPLQAGLYTTNAAYTGPWANDPAFMDWLLNCCRREKVDAVLSGNEAVLSVLAREKQRIESETGAICLVSDPEIMEIGDDKLRTCIWLEEQGFNVPQYADAGDADAVARLRDAAGYPLLAKPRRGGGAAGVLKIENDDDLAYIQRREQYLIQEYIGDDESEYTVGCFIDADGQLRGSLAMRRVLLSGTTYRAIIGDFPEVRREAEGISIALRPMGPCNIQLRMTDHGPVCFEINPRFSGSGPIRAWYGYNEAEAALRHFVLGETAVDLPRVTEGIALRYWNEVYPDPEAHRLLAEEGRLADNSRFNNRLEEYGMR